MIRLLHRLYATLGGYFWLPCPLCGREFGGHEWREVGGHLSDIPDEVVVGFAGGTAICPRCTAAGAGCRAWAANAVTPYRTEYSTDCDCRLWEKAP